MGHEQYITDNPFRILNVGSLTSQRDLSRLAASHAMSSRVGLIESSPLDQEFGHFEYQDLVSHVRSISNDARKRTLYRFFWPLSDASAVYLRDGGHIKSGSLPKFEVDHLLFLSDWFDFLSSESSANAKEALASWARLHEDYTNSEDVVKVAASIKEKNPSYNINAAYSIIGIKLTTAIKDDDELEYNDAFPIWDQVSVEIGDYLVTRLSQAAEAKWNEDVFGETLALMEVALNSKFVKVSAASLDKIIDSGIRRLHKIESLQENMPDFKLGSSMQVPEIVTQLVCLSKVLGPYHPSASLWQDAILQWNECQVYKVRQLALTLSEGRRYVEALGLISMALTLEIAPGIKRRLEEDRSSLEDLISADIYRDILPIASAPSLQTFNGIGQTLYQTSRFPGDPTKHFAILFFTIAYIPIIPIQRYLVTPSGRNSWIFHGKTAWTNWMKGHVAGVIGLVIIFAILGLKASPNTSEPLQSSQETNLSNGVAQSASSSENIAQPTNAPPPSEHPTAQPKHQSAVGNSEGEPHEKASGGDSSNLISETKDDGGRANKRKLQETKLASMSAEIDGLKLDIENETTSIDAERAKLTELKASIDGSTPNTANSEEVSAYNAIVDRYNADRLVFNDHIAEVNAKIAKQKSLVARYNDLVRQINEDR